jgi:GNAT superfamily N-acetyltransferase
MIEPVAETDLDEIRALIALAIQTSVASSAEEFEFLTADIDKSLHWWRDHQEESLHLKYTAGAKIVGVALIKRGWNLTNLFVHPAYYRHGIATALLNEAVRRCRPISPKQGLRVNSSTFAVPFYEQFGFYQTGEPVLRAGGCVPMTYDF